MQSNVTGGGNLDLSPTYKAEPISKLMTGVVYGGNYGKMPDNPDCDVNNDDIPDGPGEYYTTRSNNCGTSHGVMVIDLEKVGTSWTLAVTVGGKVSYLDTNFSPGAIGNLLLQSHWGSGVRFTGMAVERYDEN